MWYAPIIPRLKRLFRNKEHARLLRWHKEERKKDGKLRHPADGSQWRKIERDHSDFTDEARNLWFGLSTDGMNPFGEQSCSHSTWPVTMYLQPSSLVVHEAEVHYDASAHPGPEATRQ
jgi:hypothetical protein